MTGILLRFPEGVNRRKLLRILDQQGHYFGGMEGQTLAYHLIHRMQDGDLAWCELCPGAVQSPYPAQLSTLRAALVAHRGRGRILI